MDHNVKNALGMGGDYAQLNEILCAFGSHYVPLCPKEAEAEDHRLAPEMPR